jgi:hypothetical protein
LIERIDQSGFTGYVSKPIDASELLKKDKGSIKSILIAFGDIFFDQIYVRIYFLKLHQNKLRQVLFDFYRNSKSLYS